MWRIWNAYYHPQPPKWMFLTALWVPLVFLYILGYFILSFQVVEIKTLFAALSDVESSFEQTVQAADFNSTDYNKIELELKKSENLLIKWTVPYFDGNDGQNGFLTANFFFGGAEFNKTGGVGILIFVEFAASFLIVFIVTYLVGDLYNGTGYTVEENNSHYAKLEETRKNMENSTEQPEKEEDSGENLVNTWEDPDSLAAHKKWMRYEENRRDPFFCLRWLRAPLESRLTLALLLVNSLTVALFIQTIVVLLVLIIFPDWVNGFDAISALMRRFLGIQLTLEVGYTLASWIYSIFVAISGVVFHVTTLCFAKVAHSHLLE